MQYNITMKKLKALIVTLFFCATNLLAQNISYEAIVIKIPLANTSITSPEEVSIEFPVCKYDKKFAFSFTGDDALLGIYQRAFNYAYGHYVDNDPIFHEAGEKRTTGITPTRQLTYTDGCGKNILFRFSTNWQASKDGRNVHKDGNITTPQIWWSECERFTDFYNGILNHGGAYDETDAVASINKTLYGVADTIGIYPYVLGVPGATSGFPEAGKQNDDIYFMESGTFYDMGSYVSLNKVNSTNLYKGHFPRVDVDKKSITDMMTLIKSHSSNFQWINVFCHDIKNATSSVNSQLNSDVCFAMLDSIYDKYGKNGFDNVWFGTTPEIYEYLFTRIYSSVEKKIVDNQLVLTINAAVLPHFYYKDITLKLKRNLGISMKNLSFSSNVTKESYQEKGDSVLINLCFSDFPNRMAEKYTSKLESNITIENKNDASFFVDMLEPTLQKKYSSRIDAALSKGSSLTKTSETATKLEFFIMKGKLKIIGEIETPIPVYSLEGVLLKVIPKSEENVHEITLNAGTYLIDGHKIIVL